MVPGNVGEQIVGPMRPSMIRAARKSDASALAVLVDIAGEGMPAHMWRTMKAPRQSVLEFGRSRAARDEGGFSWRNATVIEVDDEVAGGLIDYRLDDPYDAGDLEQLPAMIRPLVTLEARVPGSWYVNVLATFPEFRGQGLGTRLLERAENRAREAGARNVSLIVESENPGALRLYQRLGYQEQGRETLVKIPGEPHGGDWVLMVKRLSA